MEIRNIKEIDAKNIHLVTPFTRHHLFNTLVDAYKSMDILWHIILFQDQWEKFEKLCTSYKDCKWIFPVIIPMSSKKCNVFDVVAYKVNWFIQHCAIIDEDYYVFAGDDDMFEEGVFDKIKLVNDDIVVISMKRGHHTPRGLPVINRHPTNTLIAHPDNMKTCSVGAQQYFVKGMIFREHPFNEKNHYWDGEMIVHYKESGEQIRYEPTLFALFNYYEPGRWK